MFVGICTLCKPWEALVIGAIGVIIAALGDVLLWKIKVDPPRRCRAEKLPPLKDLY